MNNLSNNYNQTGVFFTNEIKDGSPWEGLLNDDNNMIWNFDAAIIPKELINKYKGIRNDYFHQIHENRLNIARREVWTKEPW